MTDGDNGACLRYVSGEILALRVHPNAEGTDLAASATSRAQGGSLAASATFDAGRVTLELHAVVPGAELWHLEAMQRASPDATFSLNYLGTTAGWLFGSRSKQSATAAQKYHVGAGLKICSGWPSGERPIDGSVLIVDVEPGHCGDVMLAAAQGAKGLERDHPIVVLGISLGTVGDSLATLYEYLTLLLTGVSEAPKPVVAVNMSVDFGQACRQSDAHLDGVSTVCLSFPLFERALGLARAMGSTDGCTAAFIAAAGNRLRDTLGLRLAYPAVRPEVIAVTSASPNSDGMELSDAVDCPAVCEFKPCFAVSERDVAASGASKPATTSMAAGYASGRYSALAIAGNGDLRAAPPLAKIAQLQACSERAPILEGSIFWTQPNADPMPSGSRAPRQRNSLESLLYTLNRRFPTNEFLISGSMAAVAALLKRRSGLEWMDLGGVSYAFGDVDLVSALPLGGSDIIVVRELVNQWLSTWSRSDHAIDMAHRDASVALPTLCQVIVPAAQLAATQDGFVDGHGGLDDIKRGALRVLAPEWAVWSTNPAFRVGNAGGALGVLVWVNTCLVLNIASAHLSRSGGEPHSGPPRRADFELDRQAILGIEAQLHKEAATFRATDIREEQQKLRPRLDRAFRLVRLCEHLGLDVSRQRALVLTTERIFLSGLV